MHRRTLFFVFSLLLTVSALWGSGRHTAQAAVTLQDFDVVFDPATQSMRILWETGTEADAAGFYFKRVVAGDAFIPVNDPNWDEDIIFVEMEDGDLVDFIDSRGDTATGADYLAIDSDIELGETYSYLLVEEEINGQLILPAPAPITVFAGTPPTPTSQAIGGGATATPTLVPSATATQQVAAATNTPPAGSTSAPTPTNEPGSTPAPTATPSPTSEPDATDIAPSATATDLPDDDDGADQDNDGNDTGGVLNPQPTDVPTQTPATGGTIIQPAPTTPEPDRTDPLTGEASDDRATVTDDPGSIDDGAGGIDVVGEGVGSVPGVSAQEQPGYPVDAPDPGATETPEGYVPPTAATGDNAPIGGSGSGDGSSGDTTVIGANDGALPPPIDASAAGNSDSSGPNLLLWGIFIAALLVFGGGVIGSILIFTRQRSS